MTKQRPSYFKQTNKKYKYQRINKNTDTRTHTHARVYKSF
jgi:hypothetical protein